MFYGDQNDGEDAMYLHVFIYEISVFNHYAHLMKYQILNAKLTIGYSTQ